MKAGKMVLGLVLLLLAAWVYFNMEDAQKYFGGIILALFGIIMLFMGFSKEQEEAPAPPEPMKPDEHTPTEKTEPVEMGHESDNGLETTKQTQNQESHNEHEHRN